MLTHKKIDFNNLVKERFVLNTHKSNFNKGFCGARNYLVRSGFRSERFDICMIVSYDL